MKRPIQRNLRLGAALFASLILAFAPAASHGEPRNEDEWHDPGDWFDWNNYEYDDSWGTRGAEWNTGERNDRRWSYGNRQWDFDDYSYGGTLPYWRDRYNDETAREERRSAGEKRNVAGRVEGFREVNVRDREGRRDQFTVARLRLRDGRTVLVDLGRRLSLQQLDLEKGDHVNVTGMARTVSGQPLLVAESISADGQMHRIARGRDARDSRDSRASRESETAREVWSEDRERVTDRAERRRPREGRAAETAERAERDRQPRDEARERQRSRAEARDTAHAEAQPKARDTAQVQARAQDQAESRAESRGDGWRRKADRGGREAVIEPDARELFEKVRAAYGEVKSLRLAGVFSSDVAVDGVAMKSSLSFTSSFQAPNRFRHETADMLVGSDGEHAFVFNKKANNFIQASVAGNRELHETLPASAMGLLHTHDPSLLGVMMHRPFARVLQLADRVERIDDAVIEGRRYPQLVLRGMPDHGPISVLIDPETHLARRVTVDMRRVLDEKSEESRTRRARVVVDYTSIDTNPEFEAGLFAWQAGAGAKDVARVSEEDARASESLVGKPAPDFQLETLDGKKVSMRDLQGKVVMLDFWANWCPPCADSLPHLGRIYREQAGDNVVFYAIHVGDRKEDIRAFLEAQDLRIPVLVDADGAVAKAYEVRGVPKTVIVGMDGKVLRSFTGLGGDRYDRIRNVLAQASGQPRAGAGRRSEPVAGAEGTRGRGSRDAAETPRSSAEARAAGQPGEARRERAAQAEGETKSSPDAVIQPEQTVPPPERKALPEGPSTPPAATDSTREP